MDDWTFKHVLTTFIVGLFIVIVAGALIGGCNYNSQQNRLQDRQRRAAVEQCVNTPGVGHSAADCRLAVYGHIGNY